MPVKSDTVRKPVTLDRLVRSLGIDDGEFLRALELGGVLVDGRREWQTNRKLKPGMEVRVCYGEEPPDFTFDPTWVLLEEAGLLALNKPAGMTTQGTRCFDVNHLFYFAKQYTDGYVGLHHRLDRDTSGAVLFTTDRSRNRDIAGLFRDREIRKEYLAVVHGKLSKKQTVDAAIGRIPVSDPARYWTDVPDGRPARTVIEPIAGGERISLVRAIPETGRTHQVRVHLAALGYPIVGDSFYNATETDRNLRTLLHCHRLTFTDPRDSQFRRVTAPVPDDMGQYLADRGIIDP